MFLLKNTWLGKTAFFIVLFLFVYPFKMVGFPVSFRVLFSAFGGGLLLIRMLALQRVYFSSRILYLSLSALSVCIVAFISAYIINHTGDPEFVNFWILTLLCLLSSYFIISFGIYVLPGLDFLRLSKYFIAVVLAQALISAAMFLNPSIYTALLSIQQMDDLDMIKSESSIGSRLLGLGASFMIMGVINCIALLLAAIVLKHGNLLKKGRFLLITSYLIIFVIGMMQSRTTLLGLLVSVAYLSFSSFQFSPASIIGSFRRIGSLVLVSSVLLILVIVFAGDFLKKNQQIIQYGFELVSTYQKTGKFQSTSTNQLEDMYVFPENSKTYLIGDGRYNIVPGVAKYGYYMHTDVGILRLLFYFGIPGLLVFSIYQFLLIKYSFSVPLRDCSFIIFYFFVLVILWNLKSVMDTNILFTPFCLLNIMVARSKRITQQPITQTIIYQHA